MTSWGRDVDSRYLVVSLRRQTSVFGPGFTATPRRRRPAQPAKAGVRWSSDPDGSARWSRPGGSSDHCRPPTVSPGVPLLVLEVAAPQADPLGMEPAARRQPRASSGGRRSASCRSRLHAVPALWAVGSFSRPSATRPQTSDSPPTQPGRYEAGAASRGCRS